MYLVGERPSAEACTSTSLQAADLLQMVQIIDAANCRRPLPLYEPLGRRMPVGREHGLHLSRLILDGLVPTDTAMRGAEGCHGLDELVDLGIQECTTILRPKDLGLVCCPVLPGLHREAIARPMVLHQQVGA